MEYHLRRNEKKITSPSEIEEILAQQQIFTLAMTYQDTPYMVTMDYVFDFSKYCFYFHCASQGRKIEWWKNNPYVYGQIIEDLGYILGECDHSYRSLHFEGSVLFVEDLTEKQHALSVMIEKFELNPDPIKEKFITSSALSKVVIGRIDIEKFTGKKFVVEK